MLAWLHPRAGTAGTRRLRLGARATRPRGASTWRGWPRPASPLSDPTSQHAGRDVADRASCGLQHVVIREPSTYPRDGDAQSFDIFLRTVGSDDNLPKTVGLGRPPSGPRPATSGGGGGSSAWLVDELAPEFDVNTMNIVDEPGSAAPDRWRAGQPERPQHRVGRPGSVASSYLQAGAARLPVVPSPSVFPDLSARDKEATSRRAHIAGFNLTPRQLKAHLDQHVISQEEAKRALAVAVCDHYNFVRRCLATPAASERHYVKPNVLLLGPSGSGKTHLLRALTRLLRVPFVKADATKFSATGYVGGDVEDMVRALVPAADGDVELAEFGIVYVDEVDKLAAAGGAGGGAGGGGVNTRAVQSALLKLMEDADVSLQTAGTPSSPLVKAGSGPKTLRTRHVLFIMSGAFADLEAELKQDAQLKRDAAVKAASLRRDASERLAAREAEAALPELRTAPCERVATRDGLAATSAGAGGASGGVVAGGGGVTDSAADAVAGMAPSLGGANGGASHPSVVGHGGSGRRDGRDGGDGRTSVCGGELESCAIGADDPLVSAADVFRDPGTDRIRDPLVSVTAADLIRYGLEPEFVGRIPVRVACRALGQEELVRVLTEAEGSVLGQMKADFDGYGIELHLTDAALAEVARHAASQHTGARGLVTVLEQTLRDFKFELPSTQIRRLVVCDETVRQPQRQLERLLAGARREGERM